MRGKRMTKTVVVPRRMVTTEGGVVILPLREYRRLLLNTVPAVYLKGNRARALDRLVTSGLKEQFENRTKKIQSLADLDE